MKHLLVKLTVTVTQWAISQGCRGGQSKSLVISRESSEIPISCEPGSKCTVRTHSWIRGDKLSWGLASLEQLWDFYWLKLAVTVATVTQRAISQGGRGGRSQSLAISLSPPRDRSTASQVPNALRDFVHGFKRRNFIGVWEDNAEWSIITPNTVIFGYYETSWQLTDHVFWD